MRFGVFCVYSRYRQREATLVGIILHVACGRSILPVARIFIISSFHSIAYHGHGFYQEVSFVSIAADYLYTARQTVTAVLRRQFVMSLVRVILYPLYTVHIKGERFLVSPYLVTILFRRIIVVNTSVAEEEEFIVSSGIIVYALCFMNIQRCLCSLSKYPCSGYVIHNIIDCPIAVGTIKIERSLHIVAECSLATCTSVIERLRRSPFHVANKISHTCIGIMLHLPVGGISVFVKLKAEGIHAIVVGLSVIAGHEIPVVVALCHCLRTGKFLCSWCSTNSSHSSVC